LNGRRQQSEGDALPILDVDVQRRFDSGFSLAAKFQSTARATALFGPSGAGKTSILNAIAGLLRPDAGKIVVDGEMLFDASANRFVEPHRRRIGYVFQEHLLFPHLDVAANVRFGMPPQGAVSLDAVVEALELGDLLRRQPQELSGGQQQRVALGRALLASPRLLLMDEPLASLDDERRGRILDFLERTLDSFSIPLVFVSHSQAEVRRLAERVILLDGGRVVAEGTPEEVLTRGRALELHHEMGLINLLKLDRAEEIDGRSVGRIGAVELSLPVSPASPPTRYITIEPSSVTLAATDVQGVSARNHLPGVVATIVESSGRVLVAVDVGPTLWAEVTKSAVAEMGLAMGSPVVCLLKTQSMKFV
jgi:molybdate transport system ATP-binding protein